MEGGINHWGGVGGRGGGEWGIMNMGDNDVGQGWDGVGVQEMK